MKVDQVRNGVNCRVDEVRYFVKIVDVVRVDQVRVDQVGYSVLYSSVTLHSRVLGLHVKRRGGLLRKGPTPGYL